MEVSRLLIHHKTLQFILMQSMPNSNYCLRYNKSSSFIVGDKNSRLTALQNQTANRYSKSTNLKETMAILKLHLVRRHWWKSFDRVGYTKMSCSMSGSMQFYWFIVINLFFREPLLSLPGVECSESVANIKINLRWRGAKRKLVVSQPILPDILCGLHFLRIIKRSFP